MDDTYLLNIKNLEKNVDLKGVGGMICMRKTLNRNSEVTLVANKDYNSVNQHIDPLVGLSFLLDRGIIAESRLTIGDSYCFFNFFGQYDLALLNSDQLKVEDLKKYLEKIEKLCSSGNTLINRKGRKMLNILNIYRNAHLLFERFPEESYLNLIRILDSQTKAENVKEFALQLTKLLPKRFINRIYKQIANIELYKKNQLPIVARLCKKLSVNDFGTDESLQFFFVVFYALYKYRNKFLHEAFSFPTKIKESPSSKSDKSISYIGSSFMESHIINYSKQETTSIEHYKYLNQNNLKIRKEKDFPKFYLFLPTWYFLNLIVRELIYSRLKKL